MLGLGEALYPGGRDGDGEKIFTVSAEKMTETKEWKIQHNKKCDLPEWYGGFTPTSKFTYTFRESGIGINPKIICDCGAEFHSSAGDENI